MKIEIKNRFNGSIICSGEFESLKQAVEKNKDLQCAYLRGADLRDANLWGADLRDADLRDADLRGSDLQCANLRGADLRDADLRGADLQCANLRGADFDKGIYYIGNIGSRNDFTIYNIKTDEIRCGCWTGTIKEFKKRIIKVYLKPENKNKIYYKEYINAIKFFESMRKK